MILSAASIQTNREASSAPDKPTAAAAVPASVGGQRKNLQLQHASDQDLLGPPAMLQNEDPSVFAELLARISAMLNPRDILEHIWVRDVVYLVWEQERLRRIKVTLLDPKDIVVRLKHIDRIDQMCLRAGLRRDAILREIERYRNSAVLKPQVAIENAEWAEVA